MARARGDVPNFRASVQTLINFAQGKAEEYHTHALRERGVALALMGLLLTCALLCAGIVAVLTTKSITLPLGAVVARLKDVSVGDFGEDLDMRRGDEIGQLADAFRDMRSGLMDKVASAQAVAEGDLSRDVVPAGERDALSLALGRMIKALRLASEAAAWNDWVKTGKNELALLLAGEPELGALSDRVAGFLAPYLDAQVGALFVLGADGVLTLTGGYAYPQGDGPPQTFRLGQGLVGQAAQEGKPISVAELPEDYIRVRSALGEALPRNIVVVPLVHEGRVKGVLELGSLGVLSEIKRDFLDAVSESIGQAISTVENRARMRELLEKTQLQAEDLQSQQEELRAVNEELEQQA